MIDMMDKDGITKVSLENLKEFLKRYEGRKVTKIEMRGDPNEAEYHTLFTIEDAVNGNPMTFMASGFSWGYCGEGPNGLVKAFRLCGYNIDPGIIYGMVGVSCAKFENGSWAYSC